MHFSKTYSQLLLTLPPDLREKAIEYRQLKKLINRVVLELTALGMPIIMLLLLPVRLRLSFLRPVPRSPPSGASSKPLAQFSN